MTRCVRCGLEQDAGELTQRGECALPQERRMACRDREISNLRSLLRSVTIKLEKAAQEVDDGYNKTALELIQQVLETLS